MRDLRAGTLPSGWISAAIGDLAEVNPKRLSPGYGDDVPVVFVPMARVAEQSRGMDVQERRPFAKVMRGYSQFQPDDVLFAKITPCMENGKVAVVPDIEPQIGYGSTEFFVLRPHAEGISAWIARCVSQARFRRLAQKNMQGAVGQLRVPKAWIENAEIPVAPPAEQPRILGRIDALFAKLDDGVAALNRAETNLERYRASALKAAAEGRLTEQWRSENPPEETGEELLQRILAERPKRWEEDQLAAFAAKGRKLPRNWRSRYKEPVAPDTSDLPALPEGWCWATVDQVGQVIGGLTKNQARAELRTSFPYLRVANVYADELRLEDVKTIGVSESELERVLLRAGDLMVVEGNGSPSQIGRVAEWNGELITCGHQNHLIKVRCDPGRVCLPRWLLLWLLSPLGRRTVLDKASSTSGLYTLSLSKVRGLPFPLAPYREQVEAVKMADSLREAGRLALRRVQAGIGVQSAALRQSILKRAFEGRLVPQDPDDEPAAVLLERIRTTREA